MKKTLKIATIFVAMALVFAGCKAAPDENKDEDKFSAPDVGKAKDLPASGGDVPTSPEAAVELYEDSISAFGSFLNDEMDTPSSIRKSLKPSLASIKNLYAEEVDGEDRNYDEDYPIDIDEEVGGGRIKLTGNIKLKGTFNTEFGETEFELNKTYPILSQSEEGNIDGTVTDVTIEDDGESYTYNGQTKNELDFSMDVSLKMGSKSDGSDSKIRVGAEFGIAFGNAFSVKRLSDGAGAKFVLTYGATFGPETWDFAFDSKGMDEARQAFGHNLREYFESQEATLTVYDDNNVKKFEIKLTGDEALNSSMLFTFGN